MTPDNGHRSSSPVEPRRRETLLLGIVGLATALLLFASAALPVLSDRAPDATSGATPMPRPTPTPTPTPTTGRSPPPPSPAPPETAPTVAPPTVAPPAPAPPSSIAPTAPPDAVPEFTAVPHRRSDRGGVPVRPLTVGPIDISAYPTVAFDVVVPAPLAAVSLRSSMVSIDGVPVDSLTAVPPRDIAIALVIDDSASVRASVVGSLQGASVELVRNAGRGTEIALATPSGLASAFTRSRDASISRIAGITAGSSTVAPLPGLLTDSLRELAANPTPDRHAVLLLGETLDVTAEQLRALEQVIAESGTQLHLIVPDGVDATALATVARASGGVVTSAANVVASIDEVTAAIARRYRVVATVTIRREHSITLSVDDLRYAATMRSL